MAYLHENREDFTNAVNLASEYFHILPIIVEKDYYVTMILRELSHRQDFIVFKGGTSLSKCYKAVKRFSEDIDITIDYKLLQGQMRKLKESIKDIAQKLGLSIPNINETRSRRSYNRYIFEYKSVLFELDDAAQPEVNVPKMLDFLIENEIYRDDYENITARILEEDVDYDVAIEAVRKIATSGMFQ